MELKNVYTGFTKDGKDRCLQEKYQKMDKDVDLNGSIHQIEVDYPYYYDLENKCIFYNEDVNHSTLQSVSSLFGEKKREWKRKVVKAYKADRSMLIDTKRMFYGNLIEINAKYCTENVVSENVLFARMDDPEGRVMSLCSSKYYPFREKALDGFAVEEVRPIDNSQFDEVMQPKRKLLEMHYKKGL